MVTDIFTQSPAIKKLPTALPNEGILLWKVLLEIASYSVSVMLLGDNVVVTVLEKPLWRIEESIFGLLLDQIYSIFFPCFFTLYNWIWSKYLASSQYYIVSCSNFLQLTAKPWKTYGYWSEKKDIS